MRAKPDGKRKRPPPTGVPATTAAHHPPNRPEFDDQRALAEARRGWVDGPGDTFPGNCKFFDQHADDAFARALSVELYREMSRSVFTASNMPILVAELMPAVSSYLTIRAASTAMRCHLPERDIRDIDDVPDAVDGEDAPSVMDTAKTKIADVASATSASFTAAGEATTRAFSEMNRSLSKLWRP